MHRLGWALLIGVATAACAAPTQYTRAGGAVGALPVQTVAWNPAGAKVDAVFVADAGEQVTFFGQSGITTLVGGAIAGSSTTPDHTWVGAEVIPAPDGLGVWMVGLTKEGPIFRARSDGSLENLGGRYGLERDRVVAAHAISKSAVAFLTDRDVVVADGKTVTRYDLGPRSALAAGGGVLAVVGDEDVARMDVVSRSVDRFRLTSVAGIAVNGGGSLHVVRGAALYVAEPHRPLALRYVADAPITHITASGDRVWFLEAGQLGTVDPDHRIQVAGDTRRGFGRLAAASGGEVWVMGAETLRFGPAAANAEGRWSQAVRPIFGRACSGCHLPGGASGVDLSTFAAWSSMHDLISKRVVSDRTMPPSGHPLDEGDRTTLKAWLDQPSGAVAGR